MLHILECRLHQESTAESVLLKFSKVRKLPVLTYVRGKHVSLMLITQRNAGAHTAAEAAIGPVLPCT